MVSNAVRYSPAGASVSAVLTGRLLSVTNTGVTIPEEDLADIFTPFRRVDKSRSRKAGGAGLGLALCEEICRIHKGAFAIDSRVGKGTLITLRFPLTAPPVGEEEP